MRCIGLILAGVLVVTLAACSPKPTKFKDYVGPEVTGIVVQKAKRKMYLMHEGTVLKTYRVGLGFAPVGAKTKRGDGKTPEGHYRIDRRNPNSQFHLSLGISYPNNGDNTSALEAGVNAGGDIFIHGRPEEYQNGERDWTAGCIAVTDEEIEEIYAMVKNGTPISIYP